MSLSFTSIQNILIIVFTVATLYLHNNLSNDTDQGGYKNPLLINIDHLHDNFLA